MEKPPFLNRLLFPDLNGQWGMTIHWQRKEDKGIAKATAHIKQDLLKISMEVDSEDSDSITLLAKPKRSRIRKGYFCTISIEPLLSEKMEMIIYRMMVLQF